MATSLTIRNLPDDVVEALRRQADDHGQSLQAYMAEIATRTAERPTLKQWAKRVAERQQGWGGIEATPAEVVDAIDADQ